VTTADEIVKNVDVEYPDAQLGRVCLGRGGHEFLPKKRSKSKRATNKQLTTQQQQKHNDKRRQQQSSSS
jgi:hypothetical protein